MTAARLTCMTAATMLASWFGACAIHAQTTTGDQAMTVLAQASSGPLRCEIRKTQAGGAVELAGFVISSQPVAGQFRFVAMKSGPAGSSNVAQANTFDLAAGQEMQIAHMTIGLEPGSRVTIALSVTSAGAECHASATL
jgi:hypothetical protein